MQTLVYVLIGVVAVAVLIPLIWRLASRRRSLPCPVWLRWMVELDNPFTKTNRAAVIIEHLGLEPGMVALDAGCGPGRLTIPLARAVGENGRVVALDIQTGMLDRVRAKAQAANLENIEYLQAELGEGSLEQKCFDRVVLVTVLGEIPDRRAALEEVFASLKPGGILSVTEIIFDPHFQRRHAVAQLAEAASFREQVFYGSRIAYTLHFEKPRGR